MNNRGVFNLVTTLIISIILVGGVTTGVLFGILKQNNSDLETNKENQTNLNSYEGNFAKLGLTGLGREEYIISSKSEKIPKFVSVTINPLDVLPGDPQNFTVRVYSPNGIKEVTSFTELDNSNVTFNFKKIGIYEDGVVNDEVEIWYAEWVADDVHTETYRTYFTAIDNEGNENTHNMSWTDSCQSQITHGGTGQAISSSCSTAAVDGIDGADITINGALTISSNSVFYFNSGQKITIGTGSIDMSNSGGKIEKAYLYNYDYDEDGYASTSTLSYHGSFATLPNNVRAKDRLGTYDCCDYNTAAHPGATKAFPVPISGSGCSGYDYNCNGQATKSYSAGGSITRCDGLNDICVSGSVGYTGASPSCGSSGTYVTTPGDCSAFYDEPWACIYDTGTSSTTTRTQMCI